jgi:hypothetical protein
MPDAATCVTSSAKFWFDALDPLIVTVSDDGLKMTPVRLGVIE